MTPREIIQEIRAYAKKKRHKATNTSNESTCTICRAKAAAAEELANMIADRLQTEVQP